MLHHDRSTDHAITVADVPDSQLDEIAGPQLAVHTQMAQGELAAATSVAMLSIG